MKSRTSFSKLSILRKDITRFAPIWVLYGVIMLLVLTDTLGYGEYDHVGYRMKSVLASFSVVNMIYAGICAVILFGDLYNTRMCYSLHSLPQRRETWFLSHTASAMLFSLVPNILAALFMMLRLESYWFLALYWLLGVSMQFIFFFGLAAVSVMLTGNRFAMLAVYAGLNFVSLLTWWILDTIYLPQMNGVVLNTAPFITLCPTVKLAGFPFFTFQKERIPLDDFPEEYRTFYRYESLAEGWEYMGVLVLCGIGLLGLAVVLYRLRHLESAGDFIAFRQLKGAACIIITLCFAGAMAFVGDMIFGTSYILWLIVGLVVGYFGSLMLLERRVKVFRKKTFASFAILSVLLVASFLMVVFDVFGIVHFVPKAENVRSVTLANYIADDYNLSKDYYYGNRMAVELTEQEDIQQIILAHQDILDHPEDNSIDRRYHTVVLIYKLDSGAIIHRRYQAPVDGENYKIVRKYLYTAESIMGYTDFEDFIKSVEYIFTGKNQIENQYAERIMEAARKDVMDGNIETNGTYKEVEFWIDYEIRLEPDTTKHISLACTKDAKNLKAVLSDPQVVLGYSHWESFLSHDKELLIDRRIVTGDNQKGLLEALKQDASAGTINLYDDYDGVYYVEIMTRLPDGSIIHRNLSIPLNAKYTNAWLAEHGDLFS